MKKNLGIALAVALAAAVGLAGGLYGLVRPEAGAPTEVAAATPVAQAVAPPPRAGAGARDSTFLLDGRPVTLKDGVSAVPAAPGSASRVITRDVGAEGRGDLTNDGREDIAFVVTQDRGGSGLFYFVVVAVATAEGYRPTNAFFIGDRIALRSLVIPRGSSELHVNFAQRAEGEPMTARPSEEAVLLLKVTEQGVLEGLMK